MGIVKVDLQNNAHCDGVLRLMADYMADNMGGNLRMTTEQSARLIADLNSNTSYHGFFYEFNSQYIALANCFDAYSTFQARKILNIHDFIVFHTSRGKGFGKKLMAEIIEYAKQEDYCRITLEVRTDNEKAQSLYRNSGFSPCNPEMLFWQNIL